MWRYFLEGSTELPAWRRQAWTAVSFNRALFTHESRLCVNPRLVTQRTAVEICVCACAPEPARTRTHRPADICGFPGSHTADTGSGKQRGSTVNHLQPRHRRHFHLSLLRLSQQVANQRQSEFTSAAEIPITDTPQTPSGRQLPQDASRWWKIVCMRRLHSKAWSTPARARGVKEMLLTDHDLHMGSNCTTSKSFQLLLSPLSRLNHASNSPSQIFKHLERSHIM